jgi:hypothetical protein
MVQFTAFQPILQQTVKPENASSQPVVGNLQRIMALGSLHDALAQAGRKALQESGVDVVNFGAALGEKQGSLEVISDHTHNPVISKLLFGSIAKHLGSQANYNPETNKLLVEGHEVILTAPNNSWLA